MTIIAQQVAQQQNHCWERDTESERTELGGRTSGGRPSVESWRRRRRRWTEHGGKTSHDSNSGSFLLLRWATTVTATNGGGGDGKQQQQQQPGLGEAKCPTQKVNRRSEGEEEEDGQKVEPEQLLN
jgi:hypothetical protein